MSAPFLGEIRMFGGNFAPRGWALCAGQLVAISTNEALYTLIGTTYGGDGVNTFGLPDLRSRIPVHQGQGFVLGQVAGTEQVTLTSSQMAVHNHIAMAQNAAGSSTTPVNNLWASSALNQFSTNAPDSTMNPASIGPAGNSQPHNNIMPYQAINFIIALEGVYPSQN